MDSTTALALLGRLFPADSSELAWDDFAEGLSKELGGGFCAIWGALSLARPLGVSHADVRCRLREYHASGDVRYGPLLEVDHPIGRAAPSPTWMDGGSWMREVLGIGDPSVDGLLLPLVGDGWQVRSSLVAFPLEGDSLPAGAPALLERLAPWLAHGVRAIRRERLASSRAELHRWLSNHLRFGLLFLDAEGRILFANRAGASMLEGHDVSDFSPEGAPPGREERLEHALAALWADQREAYRGPRSHIITSFPLTMNRDRDRTRPERTAVVITSCAEPAGFSQDWLRERYQLTPAEARLAALLAADSSLEEAAEELGLAVGTVRTRLKSIFSKTDTHRQASLVRLLLSEPRCQLDL
jgi:DNA-binding CsgD family transcriptional regulator